VPPRAPLRVVREVVKDAFDPGELGDYPWFPRNPDGSPCWSESAVFDGVPVNGVTPMPRGRRWQAGTLIDVTPTSPDGSPIVPPVRVP